MPQSQRLSSAIPFVAIERPACPKCKAAMMLASIEPVRAGVDLHTFECAICNQKNSISGSLSEAANPTTNLSPRGFIARLARREDGLKVKGK